MPSNRLQKMCPTRIGKKIKNTVIQNILAFVCIHVHCQCHCCSMLEWTSKE